MMPWQDDPSPQLVEVFSDIARTRMADVPICNAALAVEAVGFRRGPDGQWVGALVTPWAINLLCLPAADAPWPEVAPGGQHGWRFPSGDYEFIVAEEARLGVYHLCSLFSPALEFESHAAARLTAEAAMAELLAAPPEPPRPAAPSRRAFLGLRG